MNEIMKEYQDEIAERSITAKSYHAHNGNNGQKLGNRQLTNKEIEERHGPVKTYTFDDFLTFPEFREMPLDWQAGYINHLQDKYDIGLTQINRDLFGQKDENMLRSHLKIKGILDKVNPDKRRGRTKIHDFRRDIREYRTNPKKEERDEPIFCFVTLEGFKKLTHNEQHLFINQVLDRYGRDLGIKVINRELFQRDNNCLREYLVNHGFDMARDFGIKNGGNRHTEKNAKALEQFRIDIAKWRNSIAAKEILCNIAQKPLNAPMDEVVSSILSEDMQKQRDNAKRIHDDFAVIEASTTPEPITDKRMTFATSYISTGFDMGQIELIQKLFAGQKIKVEIGVEVL